MQLLRDESLPRKCNCKVKNLIYISFISITHEYTYLQEKTINCINFIDATILNTKFKFLNPRSEQSYLNYCSLVWGFSAKSNIHSLFIKQKQGIRAVMPGYVNYWFKEGKLPAHTKEEFKKYNILTVHGTIVMNALVFMYKCRHFPNSLPVSICNLIPKTIPNFDDNINDCGPWVDNFNTIIFRPSFF